MRKICNSPYRYWRQSQVENSKSKKKSLDLHVSFVNENFYFDKIATKKNLSSFQNSIFVAIKLPTNVFIYEWFQKDAIFRVLKDFVVSMDVYHEFSDESHKNFTFVDLIFQKYEFFDDQPIYIVLEKEKEAIEQNEKPNSNITPSNRIFLKVKMPQRNNK